MLRDYPAYLTSGERDNMSYRALESLFGFDTEKIADNAMWVLRPVKREQALSRAAGIIRSATAWFASADSVSYTLINHGEQLCRLTVVTSNGAYNL